MPFYRGIAVFPMTAFIVRHFLILRATSLRLLQQLLLLLLLTSIAVTANSDIRTTIDVHWINETRRQREVSLIRSGRQRATTGSGWCPRAGNNATGRGRTESPHSLADGDHRRTRQIKFQRELIVFGFATFIFIGISVCSQSAHRPSYANQHKRINLLRRRKRYSVPSSAVHPTTRLSLHFYFRFRYRYHESAAGANSRDARP